MTPYGDIDPWWHRSGHIGSGNGLLPDGTKPLSLPEPKYLMSEVVWNSPKSNFTVSTHATILQNEFGNYIFFRLIRGWMENYKYQSHTFKALQESYSMMFYGIL